MNKTFAVSCLLAIGTLAISQSQENDNTMNYPVTEEGQEMPEPKTLKLSQRGAMHPSPVKFAQKTGAMKSLNLA
jgi:hypothetical protein